MPNSVLVVTAVAAEANVVRRVTGFDVVVGGVGQAAVAAATARALANGDYGLVVNAGIAGGFGVPIGGVVVSSRIIAADLGAEMPDGSFLAVSDMGFGINEFAVDPALASDLVAGLSELSATLGPILTVNTVTGTAAGAQALLERHPDAAAEAMEGFGVAAAAEAAGVPAIELRTVSNPVGPRDRDAWRIGEALDALGRAMELATPVLLKA